ncbi:hypothetical protein [Peribacillus loiseleuriae]|uniref:hypothetical protein n=1 Tax=Peribacillus loiseleuriae TaxID=1679170 RepID=UPI003D023C27
MTNTQQLPQPIQDLAKQLFGNKGEYTITDWDLDRIYIDKDDHEYTIRMWNITDEDIRWTLFKIIPDEDGGSHGEEVDYGIFEYTIKGNKRMLEWVVAGWDDETLERDETWFQGEFEPAKFEDLATIEMLRNDVKKQLKELDEDTHADGYLIPWGSNEEVLMVQEGAYIWIEGKLDYVKVLIDKMYEETYHFENNIDEYKFMDRYTAEIFEGEVG